jgi:uncharacterized protein YciI
MFVIELIYKATLAEIDATMKAHVIFLKKYYAAGNFLVSGRKIPRIERKSKRSSAKIHSFNGGSPTFASFSSGSARRQTIFRGR